MSGVSNPQRLSILLAALFSVAAIGAALVRTEGHAGAQTCDPSYPDVCIPPSPPDLDCSQIAPRNFRVVGLDPHDFDTDGDGIGCEDASAPPFPTATPTAPLPFRAWAPMLACDSCSGGATPTPTRPATPIPTGTATAASPTPLASSTPTSTPTPAPSATPTPTQATGTCGGATATITALSKSSNPETVTISGSGILTGWYVISESGNQRFDFPSGYSLAGAVTLASGPAAVAAPPAVLLWTTANIWNNSSDDDAMLYDCLGTLRSTFEDGN